MKKNADNARFLELRKRALDILGEYKFVAPDIFDAKIRKLIFELDTNRLELELQNEDLRQTELALTRTQIRYDELYEFAPVGYLTLTAELRIAESNRRAAELLGCEKAALRKRKFSDFIHSEDQDIFHLHRQSLPAFGKRQSCSLRLTASCRTDTPEERDGRGQHRHVQLDTVARADNGAGDGQLLMTISDITELTETKIALATLNNELEERVRQRNLKLDQARDQLLHSEKLAAIGTLAASIAHELNNPLQGVLNVIKGVGRRAALEPEDAELVELAVGECARMRDLLAALRDFNRPSSGLRAPVDLRRLLDSVLLLFKKEFATRQISTEVHHDGHTPELYGVADQLKQVVMNLLQNSADACRPGSKISIRTESRQTAVIIEVTDNGAGIEPAIIDHIFEPFFSTKAEVTGTGLGLAVSYGIIKSHNGTIEVDSSPYKMTRFRITLPVRKPGRRH